MKEIIFGVIAYLLGSISFSIIFSKKIANVDPRDSGSGNAGTTNVMRTAGVKAGVATLLCDILKGVVAVFLPYLFGLIFKQDLSIATMISGVMVVLGHTFPIFYGFKGGKGVATTAGVILFLNPLVAGILISFALVIIIVTRVVSYASISVALLFPVLMLFLRNFNTVQGNTWHYLLFAVLMATIIIFNHRENIKRIRNGEENKLTFKGA